MEKKRIHLIGICGIAMGSLAGMLKLRGHAVTGSDTDVYPPMSDILRGMDIPVTGGYRENNVDGADLVVIGNAISRGNPEAERVLDEGIPYCSMAQALQRFFMEGKEVVAVAGTHGKTTTTALLSHILRVAGEDPSFFVGGVLRNYDTNFGLGNGRYFVVEGDEYDSAFFEKVPKFVIYRPRHLILTSLEFDHADIYRDLGEIELWFRRLVNMIPSRGNVLYARDYENLKGIVAASRSRCHSYGRGDADIAWQVKGDMKEAVALTLAWDGTRLDVESPLRGDYNYMNVTAAAGMAFRLGVPGEMIQKGIASFQGVRRRMELLFQKGETLVYEDFAHHPTAIGNVLAHLRERYPQHVLWAVYEPRSATSRRSALAHLLPQAFVKADHVLIREPYRLETIREEERIDIAGVIREIVRLKGDGERTGVYRDADDIVAAITRSFDQQGKNVIVIMSNGGFEGIYDKMKNALAGPAN